LAEVLAEFQGVNLVVNAIDVQTVGIIRTEIVILVHILSELVQACCVTELRTEL
jgi:hypothetical protein